MKMRFCMILAAMCMVSCSRGPEGREPGDCDDGKDNDLDGLADCDDDGCSADNVCVKTAREAEEARKRAEAETQARVKQLAAKEAEKTEATKIGPVFHLDGLMVQTATNGVDVKWMEAKSYCDGLNLSGHSDWRLPTREEAVKIVESGQLKGEPSYVMWTSTETGSKRATIVGMSGAVNDLAMQFDGECRARCVRGAVTK